MHTKTALKLFSLTAVSLFWFGCQGLDNSEGKASQTSHLNGFGNQGDDDGSDPRGFQSENQFFGNLQTVRRLSVPVPAALDIQPVNGQIFPNGNGGGNGNFGNGGDFGNDGRDNNGNGFGNGRSRGMGGMSVHFTGFTTAAGQTVDVQVLSSPSAAIAEANWVSIGTTTSSATGTSSNDAALIYPWSLDAVPSDDNNRWEQGGILRYRTVATDASGAKTALPFYDLNAGDCIAAQGAKSWKDVVKACKSPFSPNIGDALSSATTAAALISPSPEPEDFIDINNDPANNALPNYLARRGFIFPQDTDDYYDFIDAPRSLNEFAERFGFFDSQDDGFFDSSEDGQNVASGLYYNLGDLGLGREIHCKNFTDNRGETGTACITKNYGVINGDVTKADFSGDAESAMDDNIRNQNSFAAVCMIKFGTKFSPTEGNDVQFMVYGADGAIVDQAKLDSVGSNEAIPNNCLNCHGGIYDQQSRTVLGSSFLPYDPESFLFADDRNFSYEAQADSFRQLNVMVRNAGSPPATIQFVNGLYGQKADQAGAQADFTFIPVGWSGSDEAKTVYNQAYKHYCRTCHTSQVGDFAFIDYQDFKGTAQKTQQDVCGNSEMPVCEGTMGQFWRSSARAYIVNSLGISDSCTVGVDNADQSGFGNFGFGNVGFGNSNEDQDQDQK